MRKTRGQRIHFHCYLIKSAIENYQKAAYLNINTRKELLENDQALLGELLDDFRYLDKALIELEKIEREYEPKTKRELPD